MHQPYVERFGGRGTRMGFWIGLAQYRDTYSVETGCFNQCKRLHVPACIKVARISHLH